MMRPAVLSLILLVSLSSASLLRKSISRRQTDPEYCSAIEGFDCKCSHYRVTCTTDRDLPSSVNVLPNEKEKYQSVELIINGERDQNVNEHTFESVKQLYKPDSDNLEFRIKFEKFTKLHLSSPGVFNRVYPDNALPTAKKHMALEIYNPLVQPDDNVNLFQNSNIDSLELYVLYPFRGTFQQLFQGANIKYLRLSGGDIKSDLSQPFTGNIGRLELAKQASTLSVQNFPVYPAHELIINAFYVTDFNSDHPPNYANLGELRIYSQERIPANAFRQFSNLHTLSISTEKDIDPHAFDGLNQLEKLTIKDTKPSLEILNSLPSLKEFETSIDKLDDRERCQLVEKLANGQLAVQAIPSGRECTCATAYLDTASGRFPCDAQQCDQSSCAAIKNNYDASTRTFKTPPAIKRVDGTDALRQREPRVHTAPYQVSQYDQEKVKHGASPPPPPPPPPPQQPSGQEDEEQQQQQLESVTQAGQTKKSRRTKPRTQATTPAHDQHQHGGEPRQQQQPGDQEQGQPQDPYHPDPNAPQGEVNPGEGVETTTPTEGGDNQQQGEGSERHQHSEGTENRQDGQGGHEHHSPSDPNQVTEAGAVDGPEISTGPPAKKKMSWIPIIIIAALIGVVLAILLIFLILRRRSSAGYDRAATTERGAGKPT